jgi:hypothetical protein
MRQCSNNNLAISQSPINELTVEIKERVATHGTFLHEWDAHSESIRTSFTSSSSYDFENSIDNSIDNGIDICSDCQIDKDDASESLEQSKPCVKYGAYSCFGEDDYDIEEYDDCIDAKMRAPIQHEAKVVSSKTTRMNLIDSHIDGGYSYFGAEDCDEGDTIAAATQTIPSDEQGYSFFAVEDLPKFPQHKLSMSQKKYYFRNMENSDNDMGYSFFGVEMVTSDPQNQLQEDIKHNDRIKSKYSHDDTDYFMYGCEILDEEANEGTLRQAQKKETFEDDDGDYTLYGL